jgi:hypothetical protein
MSTLDALGPGSARFALGRDDSAYFPFGAKGENMPA